MTQDQDVARGEGRGGEPLIDRELADRLIAQAREQGVDLLGDGGLLKQMTKVVLERSLAAELTDHLGYEPGDPAGAGSGNSRNGTTSKRLATEAGHVDLQVPRDRNATFEPQTVRKGQRRLDGVDKLVIGLYARTGMQKWNPILQIESRRAGLPKFSFDSLERQRAKNEFGRSAGTQ